MLPVGGQVGTQAIVDARALTAALCSHSDPIDALQAYDAQRRPMLNDLVIRNRELGAEAAMLLAQIRAPNGFACIDDVIAENERRAIAAGFAIAAGLDVATINSRASYVCA